MRTNEVGSEITFLDAEVLYKQGARQFKNVTFKIAAQINTPVRLPSLQDATLENCHVADLPPGVTLDVPFYGERLFISTNSYHGKPDADRNELLDLVAGKNNVSFEQRYLSSAHLGFVKKNPPHINSAILFNLLFDSDFKIKRTALVVNSLVITDCFDLSRVNMNIGDDIEKQLQFINSFSAVQFSQCQFKDGILLPEFIMKQVSRVEKITDAEQLKKILLEARQSLEQHSAAKKKTTSTKITNPDTFNNLFKKQHKKEWTGFTFDCDVDLSSEASAPKSQRTIRNMLMQKTNIKELNVCNSILVKNNFSGAAISKLIFTAKTNFEQCDFRESQFKDDAIITFVNEDGTAINFAVSTLLDKLEKKYYELRGTREKKFFKDDFFLTLQSKYPDNKGQQLIAALQHSQHQKTRFLSSARSRRTYDAFRAVMQETQKEQKEQRATSTKQSEREHTETLALAATKSLSSLPSEKSVDGLSQSVTPTTEPLEVNYQELILAAKKQLSSKDKDQVVAAYQLLMQLDQDTANHFAQQQVQLLKNYSRFDSFYGINKDKNGSKIDRTKRKDDIIFALQFLSEINSSNFGDYEKIVREKFVPAYFDYVVSGRRKRDDTTGKQTHFLDMDTLEAIFIELEAIHDAKILSVLSNHRHDPNGNTGLRFMSMPKKEEDKEAHRLFCQNGWAHIPLKSYDGLSCPAKKEDLQIEKELYIVELIKRGDFTVANNYLKACQAVWPDMQWNAAKFEAVLLHLMAEAIKKANNAMLLSFAQSTLAKNKFITDLNSTSKLLVLNDAIPDSVALTNALSHMMRSVVEQRRFLDADIALLQRLSTNPHLRWLGKLPKDSVENLETAAQNSLCSDAQRAFFGKLWEIAQNAIPGAELNRLCKMHDLVQDIYQTEPLY